MRKEPRERDFENLKGAEKEATEMEVKKHKISIHLNLAAARIRQGKHTEALDEATKAVELDATNVKALYRRGQARLSLGEMLL